MGLYVNALRLNQTGGLKILRIGLIIDMLKQLQLTLKHTIRICLLTALVGLGTMVTLLEYPLLLALLILCTFLCGIRNVRNKIVTQIKYFYGQKTI